jgi:Ca2+-binding RTX toxin-like protein
VARPFWFKVLGQYDWLARGDTNGGDQGGTSFLQALSRLFGLPAATASGRPFSDFQSPGVDAIIRIGRPQFDTVATSAASILPSDDIQLRLDGSAATIGPAGPHPVLSSDDERGITFFLATVASPSIRVDEIGAIGMRTGAPQYAAVLTDLNDAGYVYDTRTMQLMPGGPGDYPELFGGSDARIILSGDYSAGVMLETGTRGVESIELLAGNSYNLVAPDALVRAGEVLNVSAATLGPDDHFQFDGSAESDGSYFILGSDGDDIIIGGAGADRFYGLDGADAMAGGGGSDIFIYGDAGESSGTNYDTISGFDPSADRIDLPGSVSGFGAAIEGGTLSYASFNDDLSAVLGGLAPSQAVWFAPDAGDLAGQIFLIVDGNGQAGYQEGEDFVIAVEGAPLADLSGHTDIFI